MCKDDVVLLITGCICPVKDQAWLCLGDESVRLQQYVASIKFYIDASDVKKIVFCENSGFVYKDCALLVDYADAKGKKLEWLSYKGDESLIRKYGKGAGEDEIYSYALEHSELLKDARSFVKVTGRLIVENINRLINNIEDGICYFNRDVYRPHYKGVDTRFYVADKAFFEQNLLNCYKIKEKKGLQERALEDVFFCLLKGRYKCLRGFPIIKGVSAGNGRDYSKENNLLIFIFNCFGYLNLFNKLFVAEWFLLHSYYKVKKMIK